MADNEIFRTGRVAVVTGAALGIGRALSRRLISAGMRVAMVDLPGSDLDEAFADGIAAASDPAAVLKIAADVAEPGEISALQKQVLEHFGAPHLLVNNAVTRVGRGHDADLAEWRRAMEVNVWGPVMAVRAFLPAMQAAAIPSAIVNVGSKQGITNPPGHPIYNMCKSALKTYTEALEHELRSTSGNRIATHLLVPGWTTTGKNEHKSGAWLPDQVVDYMMAAMARGEFYIICPDGETSEDMDRRRILWGAQDITEQRPPLSRWHSDFADEAKKACI